MSQIGNACDAVNSLIKEVRDFTLNQNTPGDVCKTLITKIKNSYDAVVHPLIVPMAFTATQGTDYAKIEREAKGFHTTMKAELDKFQAFVGRASTEAHAALAAVKEQAAEAGVSTNAQVFLQEAESRRVVAKKWLIATISSGGLTLLVAIAIVIASIYYIPVSVQAAIQYVVAKIILLSVLSFGVIWCAHNYRSQKHNETLNQHRANALMTFRAFVEGTSDARVRDAILLQAAQAAFAGRSSGYESAETEPQTINPVVEILGKLPTDAVSGKG